MSISTFSRNAVGAVLSHVPPPLGFLVLSTAALLIPAFLPSRLVGISAVAGLTCVLAACTAASGADALVKSARRRVVL